MKTWLNKIIGKQATEIQHVAGFSCPWEKGRTSIYAFLMSFELGEYQPLAAAALILPDEEAVAARQGGELRWAPGARDGVATHHCSENAGDGAAEVFKALCSAAANPTASNVKQLYRLIEPDGTAHAIDAVLEQLRETQAVAPEKLRTLARWLAAESPDRGAVKFAIALFGLFVPAEDTGMLTTLGLHEEFTLYAAVALGNTLEDEQAESAWWSLAQRVNGWGRIHLVERLSGTKRPDIRRWLLRDGYKNSIMIEYLAYPCAIGGDLLCSLRSDDVDDALLIGAGDILEALINGGPAQDMHDYADGSQATLVYLQKLLQTRLQNLCAVQSVRSIADFVNDGEREWDGLDALGWSQPIRSAIADLAGQVLALDYWRPLVERQLSEPSDAAFWVAAQSAEILGIDPWEKRYERQESGLSDQWFHLMRTVDPQRIQCVIDLAIQQIDLVSIASGADKQMGLGKEYRQHAALDFLLQGLGRFPGKGWPLVEAGLRSPVIRNRNMAMRALGEWGESRWPEGATRALQNARAVEPDARVKQNLLNVLEGRPLE